jgi:ParB family transcriptional regulator, chromosome partitioning protein
VTRKKRLGRGLEALLNSTGEPVPGNLALMEHSDSDGHESGDSDQVLHLNVNEIDENPFQPRRDFSESELASLAESLKEHDILQPILVRIVDGRYQLISGERRLRAAIMANWSTIPARLREADDRLVSELAIVENLQRKDLNPIEKALSFKRYLEQHQCRQEILAERLKIDRSTIANLIRLLELPSIIQEWIIAGRITAGHAKALLPLGDEKIQVEFAEQIIREGMTVRAVEAAVGQLLAAEETIEGGAAMGFTKKRRTMDAQIESLQQEFKRAMGTKVKIKFGMRQNGQIIVHFANQHEFERIKKMMVTGGM